VCRARARQLAPVLLGGGVHPNREMRQQERRDGREGEVEGDGGSVGRRWI
jgi:hypothetical protein